MLRGGQGFAQDVFKSSRYTLVGSHTPLEYDVPADLLGPNHLLQIVVGNGIGETCRQVAQAIARLLVMNEVRFHEYRAACAKIGRCPRSKGEITEGPPDRHPQTSGLLLQKGAGPCCTNLVHLKIDDSPMFTLDVLGVLAPNLNNRVYLRVQMQRCTCLGRDLIDHHVCPHKITNKITPASGHTHAANTHPGTHPPGHLLKAGSHGLNRLSTGVPVLLGHKAPLAVSEHDVGADCTHIHTQEHVDVVSRFDPIIMVRGLLIGFLGNQGFQMIHL